MRRTVSTSVAALLAVLVGSIALLVGRTETRAPEDPPRDTAVRGLPATTPAPERVYMTVAGMECPLCAEALERKLTAEIPDLSDLEIDLETGSVTFEVGNGARLPDERLHRLVHEAGFAVDGSRRTPVARSVGER